MESGEYKDLEVRKPSKDPEQQEEKEGRETATEEEDLPDWNRDPSPTQEAEGWGASCYSSSLFATAFAKQTFDKASKAAEASEDDKSRVQAVAAALRGSSPGSPSSSAFQTGVATPIEEEQPIAKGYQDDKEFRINFAKRLKEKLAEYREKKLEGLIGEYLDRPASSSKK